MKKLILCFAAVLFAGCQEVTNETDALETDTQDFTTEDIKSDFDALYDGLKSAHIGLYANYKPVAYDRLFSDMRMGIKEPMSLLDAQVMFQKFVAIGDIAHAKVDFPVTDYRRFVNDGGRSFPLYPQFRNGRFYVSDNLSGLHVFDPGAEIVLLDGTTISDWVARLGRHISAGTDYMTQSILEFSFPAYVWLEVGDVDGMRVGYRDGKGDIQTVFMPFTTAEERQTNADQTQTSFTLDSSSRKADLLGGNIGYLRPGPFYNVEDPEQLWDNSAYLEFINEAFGRFITTGSEKLIIDLRNNPGGDVSFSDPIIAWFADEPFRFASRFTVRSSPEAEAANRERLVKNPDAAQGVSGRYARKFAETPYGENFELEIEDVNLREDKRYDGKVYVLVNRHSFSNAVTMSAIIQDYGFGTIVGEPTSDLATTYGAMESFTLPKTGIEVSFPKAHIIRPNGDTKPAGIIPDIAIETPIGVFEDDVVLENLVAELSDM